MANEQSSDRASTLLAIVAETRRELQKTELRRPISLDSQFDRDLGFDSLARVELLTRAERAFHVRLPPTALQEAATPRELLVALENAPAREEGTPVLTVPIAKEAISSEASEPFDAMTLIAALDWHADRHPNRTQIFFLGDEGEQRITYGLLRERAIAVAAGLQAQGLQARQTVAIMLPTSPEYFYAYFGILLAGGIPVPIYPPARLAQIEEHVRRHSRILGDAQASLLITVPQARAVARLLEAHVAELRAFVTVDDLMAAGGEWNRLVVQAGDIAFIQYTSGSTGNPKGVVLSHANLLANIRAIGQAIGIVQDDVFVSWLPLYHDMGLIAAWLSSLYFGNPFVVMSPLTFLARPEQWLWAISRYRGTLTAAPNFAYELCCRRIDDGSIQGLDLGSLRLAANGAEPVSPETLARFAGRFAAYGLRPEALAPVYGLAESTVGLAVPPLDRGPRVDQVERESFVRWGKAVPAAADDPHSLRFVACGSPLPGHEIRIVDETGGEVGERVEGQLEFRGPSATVGYYRRPDETARLRNGEWLVSGDRAYIADGEIFITGRTKDIVIRGGRNIYPHEVEAAVGAVPGVRNGCVAVFGARDADSGTERLVVVVETTVKGEAERAELQSAVAQAANDVLGEPPDDVVLAPVHSVLKTSSGKLRRSACRERYEAGGFGGETSGPFMQFASLIATALVPQMRRWRVLAGEVFYATYVRALFVLMALPTWLLIALSGTPAVAWRLARNAARLFFTCAGIRIVVRGGQLPDGTHMLVANHASYLDGLVVAAVSPRPYVFVAKQELKRHWLSRIFLARLGTEFVERFAAQQSAADAERVTERVVSGQSLCIFPEGRFTRIPGLRSFLLGAFTAAARSGVPVVPVAIRGARSVLRGDSFYPRRGTIVVNFGPTLCPQADHGNAFGEAIRLRDEARRIILDECGEPSVE